MTPSVTRGRLLPWISPLVVYKYWITFLTVHLGYWFPPLPNSESFDTKDCVLLSWEPLSPNRTPDSNMHSEHAEMISSLPLVVGPESRNTSEKISLIIKNNSRSLAWPTGITLQAFTPVTSFALPSGLLWWTEKVLWPVGQPQERN